MNLLRTILILTIVNSTFIAIDAQKSMEELWAVAYPETPQTEVTEYHGLIQESIPYELWYGRGVDKRSKAIIGLNGQMFYTLEQIDDKPWNFYVLDAEDNLHGTISLSHGNYEIVGFWKSFREKKDVYIQGSTSTLINAKTISIYSQKNTTSYQIRTPFITYRYAYNADGQFTTIIDSGTDSLIIVNNTLGCETLKPAISVVKSSTVKKGKRVKLENKRNLNLKSYIDVNPGLLTSMQYPKALPEDMIEINLRARSGSDTYENDDEISEIFTYFTPTYIDEEWICGIYQIHKNSGTSYKAINFNRKENFALNWVDVFKDKNEFANLIEKKKETLLSDCENAYTSELAMSTDTWVLTPYGILALAENRGVKGLIIPYKEVDEINQWISPINKIIKNGSK